MSKENKKATKKTNTSKNKNSNERTILNTTQKLEKRLKRKRKKIIISLIIIVLVLIITFLINTYSKEIKQFTDYLNSLFGTNQSGNTGGDADKTTLKNIARKNHESEILIHFVDVGQGDSIIIELPYGKNMIIDGGPRDAQEAVLNFIKSINVTTFDYLLLTHTDEDHVGSLDDVILATDVKNIYRPDVTTEQITTQVYKKFLEAVAQEVDVVGATQTYSEAGLIIEDQGFRIIFFSPFMDSYKEVKSGRSKQINNVSPIMMLEYFDRKVMFTGDAEDLGETMFLDVLNGNKEVTYANPTLDLINYDVDVDLLKVGHHGSRSSSTTEFLNAIKPEYGVISVGAGNSYGHPHLEAEQRLTSHNVEIERTDLRGDITVRLYSDTSITGAAKMEFIYYEKVANDTEEKASLVMIFLSGEASEGMWLGLRRNYTSIYVK